MKINGQQKSKASIEKIWKVFAVEFDTAYKWMSGVSFSYGEKIGNQIEEAHTEGRICQLNADGSGLKAVEDLMEFDEENKVIRVRVKFDGTPFGFPLKENRVRMSLDKQGDITLINYEFESDLKPLAKLVYPLIRLGFGMFIKRVFEDLAYYSENGVPHPRKQKELKAVAATT